MPTGEGDRLRVIIVELDSGEKIVSALSDGPI
jgi:hypothetical protein